MYNINAGGEKMTVYADILVLVNFIVDYFLLDLTSRFLHKKPKIIRLILGALAGGIFSLYIFLPQSNSFFEIAVHILMCVIMCLITFKIYDIKDFLRSASVLFAVNFAYSGAMIAVWYIFKPYGMVINNSVIYFNISPLFLILFSVIGYFGTVILRKIIAKTFSQNIKCKAELFCQNNRMLLCAIADTGNSLEDVFGISEIFIADEHIVNSLMGSERQNPTRYRAIPCGTVTGEKILDGYRIDRAEIIYNKRKITLKNPILAVSAIPLDDCDIIINPKILN